MSKTFSELMAAAAEVRDETAQGENTAARVGGLLAELVEYLRGCTLAEDVSVAAETGRVVLRFKRHDEEGTEYFEEVVLSAATSETAGVMSAAQAAELAACSEGVEDLQTDLEKVQNKVNSQGTAIQAQAKSLTSLGARITAAENGMEDLQTDVEAVQTTADNALTKAESAATNAALAQSVASDAATKANGAATAALKAQTAAANAKSAAEANAAHIETLTQTAEELGQDRDNLLAATAGVYNLGNFASSDEAYNALAATDVAGDEDKRVLYFTVGTAFNGIVLQTIENDYCKQFIAFATHYYFRAIYFTDGTRSAASYVEPLRYAFGDRLSWNADAHKLLLSQFGAPFNDDCTDAIPTATAERDGLMTKELVKRIETLENKVGAYHPL